MVLQAPFILSGHIMNFYNVFRTNASVIIGFYANFASRLTIGQHIIYLIYLLFSS